MLPSTVRRGCASGSPLPVLASRIEARPSVSRLAVCVDSLEVRIRGEPSASPATLTSDANGWPVLRSSVARVPARIVRRRVLATAAGSKSAGGVAFSGVRPGMTPGKGLGRSASPIVSLDLLVRGLEVLPGIVPHHGGCDQRHNRAGQDIDGD